jgi:hypothetical protein
MLLGEALDDLKKENTPSHWWINFVLMIRKMITQKTFYINASDFSVNRQEITQTAEERMIQVAYTLKNIKKDFVA